MPDGCPAALWLVVAAGVLLAFALGFAAARRAEIGSAPPGAGLARFEIHAPAGTSLESGLAPSPDGTRLAFVASENGQRRLFVRPIDDVTARALPGVARAQYPFWAPDGRRLGYFEGLELRLTDVEGRSSRTLVTVPQESEIRGASWGADDPIVYAPYSAGPLQRVSASGGRPEPASRIEAGTLVGTHRWPLFLPDGRRFAFYASVGSGTEPGTLLLGELGSLEARTRRRPGVARGGSFPNRVRGDRELIYRDAEGPMVAPFTAGDPPVVGTPARLFPAPAAHPAFSVTPDGETFVLLEQAEEKAPPPITVTFRWQRLLGERAER